LANPNTQALHHGHANDNTKSFKNNASGHLWGVRGGGGLLATLLGGRWDPPQLNPALLRCQLPNLLRSDDATRVSVPGARRLGARCCHSPSPWATLADRLLGLPVRQCITLELDQELGVVELVDCPIEQAGQLLAHAFAADRGRLLAVVVQELPVLGDSHVQLGLERKVYAHTIITITLKVNMRNVLTAGGMGGHSQAFETQANPN
jgi:hypothetical protein